MSDQTEPTEPIAEHYHIHLWPAGIKADLNSDCGCYAMVALIAMSLSALGIFRMWIEHHGSM